ncbi:hypothetical protein GOP47_0024777 [Adiantum capillus-veneris]|uniref:Glutamine amidotransferase domain-containing protein n=1 Tax=Adiantum capillus-veneris TaxID=13818 RepID=A0A9D4U3A6_ADICA|nr:hypothetical protein GOP47_0024777 [Adiantum capillus-veneris]
MAAHHEPHPSRFAVFLTGHASPFCISNYGGYGQMMVDLLRDDPSETWDILPIVDGFQPSLQQLDTYQGFVITGSKHDAHGNEPWILSLCDMLRHLHTQRKKILGICFGHQILSRALGGKTGRAPVGWELGEREVHLCLEAFAKRAYGRALPSKLRVIESHQDQVLELPPDAEHLGFSDKTPFEIFGVGDHILGIQGHPEFSMDVVMDIIESRAAMGILSEELAEYSKASITQQNPSQKIWQKLCKDFLRN